MKLVWIVVLVVGIGIIMFIAATIVSRKLGGGGNCVSK